jgi:integral membrane protein
VTFFEQPPVEPRRLDAAAGALRRYRIMAFTTGVVLICGCIALILKAADVPHMEPGTGLVWVAHGWLYLIYVVITGMLGFKLRWPLGRYALVMLAGTVPTMSFVAEHFVTRAARRAATAADPAPAA